VRIDRVERRARQTAEMIPALPHRRGTYLCGCLREHSGRPAVEARRITPRIVAISGRDARSRMPHQCP
jgi:hypothetical protein